MLFLSAKKPKENIDPERSIFGEAVKSLF